MAEYDDTNRGVLFKNDRKQTDKHPDYTGKLNVDGQDFFLDAWIKKGAKGTFMSVSVKRKDKQGAASTGQSYGDARAGNRQTSADLDDDLPF